MAAAEIVPWDLPAKLHLGWAVSGDEKLCYVPWGMGESSEGGGGEGDAALWAPGLWPMCEGLGSAAFLQAGERGKKCLVRANWKLSAATSCQCPFRFSRGEQK